jgi:hypothetical protein
MAKINVQGTDINIMSVNDEDFISLTDMLKAKDGEFFHIRLAAQPQYGWFMGIWEKIHNPGLIMAIRRQLRARPD